MGLGVRQVGRGMGPLRPNGAFEGRENPGSGKESESIPEEEEQRQNCAWQRVVGREG